MPSPFQPAVAAETHEVGQPAVAAETHEVGQPAVAAETHEVGQPAAAAEPHAVGAVGHLYVHIPFCPKVCPYCAFYKEASDRNKTQAFLDALLREVEIAQERMELRPQTIFFGGGTPSALSVSQLDFLLTGLRERLDLSDLSEWTLEMNPATVSPEKAALLLGHGVNRISMGVQSWDPQLLKVLGRVHSAEQAERSYDILREAGCQNVNLDLIFAVPTQTREQWTATLEKTIALQPDHISAYCLTYEEDTAFYQKFQTGEFTQDESWDADLFESTIDRLSSAGYAQYEISNYSRPGKECFHNLAYWVGADYLGLGPSAFSTCGSQRWQNIADTSEYSARILGGRSAAAFSEPLDPTTRRSEAIAFGLRTSHGVDRGLLSPWQEKVSEYLVEGFFEPVQNRIRLTRKGKMVADHLASTLMEEA